MAPDECGSLRNCSSSVKTRHVLKKGPWTTSEDMILVEYVRKHGEGNWNAVQRNSGLMRCGKSCRLRWANHLRPNLKKGAFSAEEEKLIVDLHAKLGNKWARMAAQLPGRTDNEIKNYWNTRLKRRQRAGLPIYPQEVSVKKEHHLNSSSPSFLSKSSSQSPGNNLFRFSFTSPQPATPYMNQNHHHLKLYGANGGLSLAGTSMNIPSNAYFNHGPSPLMSTWLLQYDSGLNYGGHRGLGLPSIQSSPATTPSSSDFMMATATSSTDGGDQDYHDQVEPAAGFSSQRNKSGMLEDMLGESQAWGCHQEHVAGNEHEKGFGLIGRGNSNSDDNSYEGQGNKGQGEGMTSMDEDLLNLLDNFPLSVPIPDWNDQGRHDTESPILTKATAGGAESQHDASEYRPVATSAGAANQDWNFGPRIWNNMPSIY